MDESSTKPQRLTKRKRAALMTLPFILMLLVLALLNMWARSVVETMPPPTPNAQDEAVTERVAAATPPPTVKSVTPETQATATEAALPTRAITPTHTPTATPISLPTLPPTATITLLGPPDQSRLMADDSITIYWTWPLPLAADQFFGIYQQEEDSEFRIGRLEQANFGTGYRWQTDAQHLTTGHGEVRYLIKLETNRGDSPLITSEPRTLFILAAHE
ncbi:MAG: hypothetical protein CSB13_08170 [Chloroflexi bacterium]|nr:MAG: hypothetical protein CSB13_08170 [Chloroflexota bacterium]